MIRNFFLNLLLLAVGLFTSCEDKVDVRSKTFCVPVEYLRKYHCSSSEPIHVVEFLSPNSLATKITHINTSVAKYQASMLDLPDSVLVTGKKFYMQFHRDANREKKAALGYCTMEYLPVNILVCEAISKSCP